jgi:hypothetical protein
VDFLTDLGIGVAIGALAGTTGTHGSARGRMTLLAAVIGLVAGFLIDGGLGAILGLLGAGAAYIVVSDLVAGAGRRDGGGAIGFLVALGAAIVAVVSLLAPILVIVVVLGLAWLGIARHRRARRKHAGLRVLR